MIKPKFPVSLLVAIVFFSALLFLPIKIPYAICVPGKIIPVREWTLVRSQDGIIFSTLSNNLMDFAEGCGNTQSDRGDQSSFRFHPDMISMSSVSAGDTIGFVYSYEVEFQWATLKGELETEKAALELYRTGEKEPLIRESRLKMMYAKKQAEQQRREIGRLNSLAEKNMIPPADMEREQNKMELYNIQADAAEAYLNSVETGYKKEQIDYISARIHALQEEISVMEKRMDYSTILSPISGNMVRSTGTDTLAIIQDTSKYVVIMPIKWRDRIHIFPGQKVMMKIEGMNVQLTGTIGYVNNRVLTVNGNQLLRAVTVIEDKNTEVSAGLIAMCTVTCPSMRLLEYLTAFIRQ